MFIFIVFAMDEIISSQELELRFRTVVEHAVDGIITINVDGLIESVNPSGCRLFGYEACELVGHNVSMLMPEPDRSGHDGYIARYVSTGNARVIGIGRDVIGRRKDGSLFPFRLSVSELQIRDRTIFTGFIHDISDLKRVEDEVIELNGRLRNANAELELKIEQRTEQLAEVVNRLLAANEQLKDEVNYRLSVEHELSRKQEELLGALVREKELSELKSKFVSMASHEFRTPLSAILSSAALVKRYGEVNNSAKQMVHLEKIKDVVGHLIGILNDILSLTKIDEGKIVCRPEYFNFRGFCGEISEEMSGLTKLKQQILCAELECDLYVYTDKRFLKNIVFNLVSNALKYSDKDVLLSTRYDENYLYLMVKDEGIGIPAHEQVHLFERFFRAGNATNVEGTGLGLSIVKKYVEMLGGCLSFESVEDVGTTFRLQLPLKMGDLEGGFG